MSIKVDMSIKSQLNAPNGRLFHKAGPKGALTRALADINRKGHAPDINYTYEFCAHIKECTKGVWLYAIMEIGERQ